VHSEGDAFLANGAHMEPQEIIGLFNAAAAVADPGEVWHYSSIGYYLLATIIERVTGNTYREYLRRSFFEPLQLNETFFVDEAPSRSAATGHAWAEGLITTVDPPSASCYGSADLYSTPADLTTWMDALAAGRLVSSRALTEMTTVKTEPLSGALSCGAGFFVAQHGSDVEWSHDGSTAGFSSQLAYYPQHRLSIGVLTNGADHCAEEIEKRIAASLLNWEGLYEDRQFDNLDLSSFAGRYTFGSREILVTSREDRLMITTPSGRNAELLPTATTEFRESPDRQLRYHFDVLNETVVGFQVTRFGKRIASAQRHD
jgi:hypothetical protein